MTGTARPGRGRVRATEWRLTGRELALEHLASALRGADAAGAVIVGDAGVGKSRLLRASADVAEGAALAVERVFASIAASSIRFGAVAKLLPDRLAADELGLLRQLRRALAGRAYTTGFDDTASRSRVTGSTAIAARTADWYLG